MTRYLNKIRLHALLPVAVVLGVLSNMVLLLAISEDDIRRMVGE